MPIEAVGAAVTDPAPGRLVAGAAAPPTEPYDADVVILSLNRAADTLAAIGSALAQNGASRHLFVLDQGSTPETLAALATAIGRRPDATLLALGRNHGVPGGRNIGAALGHGRVIVGLDNDASFADATMLARAVAALDADPTLGAIGMRIVVDAPPTDRGPGSGPENGANSGGDDRSSWGYPVALLPHAGSSFDSVTFVGAGHAIRRAAWEQAGGYDAALFFCWEEFDFCLRAIARGWRIRYRGDIVVRHRINPEHRMAWSGSRWFHYVRNRLYIGRKTGRSWIDLLPRILGYGLKGLRNGLLATTLRAIPAAARLARQTPRAALPVSAREYVRQHDAAYRGGWYDRLRWEVLSAMPHN